ncbi:msx2-interacting protein isoform X2 [Xenopus laevis]|uniref:Msx2-interacting protein n=1 Tax=Xenopus laevis TaxID=8355 RepID=A0A8J0TCQ8_XENLA|nr:msx2-interacting protein isoform X2 [Xenopus laevis]
MVRETRHLWVGNLPENVRDEKIIEHFKRYGRVESVKILPKRGSDGGVAAFVDFVDIKSAQKAHNAVNKMGDRDLRTDYNEPGTIPGAARVLDDTVSITSRSREVSGFRGSAGGPTYVPPQSLHAREGRYERRLDGASDTRERTYEHSAYGHHERGTGFDRTRHYDQDYYRDARERTLQHGIYYNSRRSPTRFDTHDTRYESRTREAFTLPSVVHRDIFRSELSREVRGRRPERNYQNSRSRSPHSSQSRNQSPQRLASQASRPTRSPSGSGSRSRSSSSDSLSSSSSTSSDSESSSSSSDESPTRSVQSAAVPAPPPAQPLLSLDKDEPRKSFGIKVQNLPVRSTDTSLKDGLFHEFKKYGKVTSVQIHGVLEERYGLVFFRQQEDQEKALNASKGKLFFGMQIEVTAWVGLETESENEFRPLDERIDEFHPKATRTLFIGNLEKTTTHLDLHNLFQRFGEIVDIDVKKVNGVPQYAFLQYSDIGSVCKAIKKMDGEYLGNNRLKVLDSTSHGACVPNTQLGFGKSMPTNCVWIDGLSSNITEQYLTRHFCRYGPVVKVVFDRFKGMALVLYNEIEYAQAAVKETKGRKIGGSDVKVDFANQESQLAFYGSMESSGQDIRDIYDIISERRTDESRRGSSEFTSAERTYYETVRTPGTYQEESRREYPTRSRELFTEWESYQGDYYEQRCFDEPREYREYRDPYEQDIREYSYRQREREREREKFETDRERDHERRQTERSQSPTHTRRPQSPTGSPSQSERITSDPERRIYSRSSDRSGSCSSLSPSRFDKLDKARAERYAKNEKTEKDRSFDSERGDKRPPRKEKTEKTEKDKPDRTKRKSKNHSPSSHSSETDQENEKEVSLEKPKSNAKQPSKEKNDKDATSKNRLDLMPCVVLTRVNEKEGKVFDSPGLEKAVKGKPENESVKSPPVDQKAQIPRLDQLKIDQVKSEIRNKVTKEKVLASHVELVEKDSKPKVKKHLKVEQPADSASSADLEKLEARKRRFADANLKCDRPKFDTRRSNQEEDDARACSKKLDAVSSRDVSILKDGEAERKSSRKELSKRDIRKIKTERPFTVNSPKDGQEHLSLGPGMRPTLDVQSRLGEPVDEQYESSETSGKKTGVAKQRHIQLSEDVDKELSKEDNRRMYFPPPREMLGMERSEADEKLAIDIDYTQSYRKQMEQNRKKQQMEMEILKSEKFGSPNKETDDYESRSLVHEVGKPPQDVTDDSPPSKKKKTDLVEFEINTKRERNYRSSRQISNESERTSCSPSVRSFPLHEDEEASSPRVIMKEIKESPKVNEKTTVFHPAIKEEPFKLISSESIKKEQITDPNKGKMPVMSPEEEYKWDCQIKQECNKVDVGFPSNLVKRQSIRKHSRDLEPGEVQSDSDDESDHKASSPKHSSILDNSRFSFLLRGSEAKLRDREEKISSSLEKNKFYSFALDKTITPDTKALLERAKSLSSSREENWSFLDWDQRFANFRNTKDKVKVDSAPRPIPSWYMKKKKIRTDSDGKSDDKKEHKEEEQEKQELFASRFLHSSIFEQDSKRLQHLEKKEDTDISLVRPYWRQFSCDGINSTPDLVQEPVVLFHSRFIELTRMQQKEKEREESPKEIEKQEEKEAQPKSPDPVPESKDQELKSPLTSVPTPVPVSQSEPLSPAADKALPDASLAKEEKPAEPVEPAPEEPKPAQVFASVSADQPVPSEAVQVVEEVSVLVIPPGPEDVVPDEISYLDTKPHTPGTSFSETPSNSLIEMESPIKPVKSVEGNTDLQEDKPSPVASTAIECETLDVVPDAQPLGSENDTEAENYTPVKDKKTYKNRRANTADKPATRKSVRIDREKRNRSTSPRGETPKHLEVKSEPERGARNAAKSPSSIVETETSEPSLPLARTRRRNVRSIYATTGDNDTQPAVKEPETPRSTRKRLEKDPMETPAVVPNKRGRPPKVRRKTGEEVSPVKAEASKQEPEDIESKESTESMKPTEGWRSPRTQKLAHSPVSSGQKKGKNEPKLLQDALGESNEDDLSEPVDDSSKSRLGKGEAFVEEKPEQKEDVTDVCPAENTIVDITERKNRLDKNSKPKVGRSKNSKPVVRLKGIEIRLNVDEVKGAMRPVEDTEPTVVSPVKTKSPEKEDAVAPTFSNQPENTFPQTPDKDIPTTPKLSPEATLLALQMELEQAVENIEKITETTDVPAYKDAQGNEVPETRSEEDGDKPAHQANETELAAAIGSIIYDISTDAESFPAAPPYPPEGETTVPNDPAAVASTTQPEEMEPETDQAVNVILGTNSAPGSESTVSASSTLNPLTSESTDAKEADVNFSESSNSAQEAEPLREVETLPKHTPRKKMPRHRNRRGPACKKTEISDAASFEQNSHSQSPVKDEKVKSDEGQSEKSSELTTSLIPEKQSLEPRVNSSSQDNDPEFKEECSSVLKNASQSPQPLLIDDVSQTSFKLRSSTENPPVSPPVTSPPVQPGTPGKPPASVLTSTLSHSGTSIMPEWMSGHEDSNTISTPPPALPPNTKASDVDTSSSTLRKILMEPKYTSSSTTTTIVTSAISEPVSTSLAEERTHRPLEAIKPVSEEKSAVPLINAVVPPAAEAPVFQEKVTIVAPKATSVISRMPLTFDPEEMPRITKHSPQIPSAPSCIPSPKIKQRQNINDSRPCMKPTMSIIEDRPSETGPSPGLRVQTSQGVVLLSYSGQKTEGPQRISAKISQIPPASAVDIEIQQSVSKTQIKQEPMTPSQILPKGPPTPGGFSAHSLVAGNQPFNASPVISSIKQERSSMESSHVPNALSQAGGVKVLTQTNPPVLMHSQMVTSSKKITDTKAESKVLQPTNLSPGLSPHHSSFSGKLKSEPNHVSSGANTPSAERALPHLSVVKQEPHSPSVASHSPSTFSRSCHPSVTASSALTNNNASVMLAAGMSVPPYMSSMHPEQTVIMPPHSVTQPVSLGHLSQGDVRINTPPLPGMQYAMRSEALHSPRAAMQPQRSTTPQPASNREMVLPNMSSQHPQDEDVHYHHPIPRGPAHVQPDMLVMPPEYRMSASGMRLDPYVPQDVVLPRDVRMIMHSHMAAVGEHHQESRQSRTPEGLVQTPPTSKTPQPVKDLAKQSDLKRSHSPHTDARILGVPPSGLNMSPSVVVPHGVPLIHPSGGSFRDYRPVYSDIRNYHPTPLSHAQYSSASSIGLHTRSLTPSQVGDGEHTHVNHTGRSKTPQVSQDPKVPPASVNEQTHHSAIKRHTGQMDSRIQHLPTPQTSYPSPSAISLKQELPSPHQSQALQKQSICLSSPALSSTLSRTDLKSPPKQEAPHRSVDMVQLLTKYPIVWQGLLALKNDTAAVQLHFVSGNNVLAHRSLPAPEGGPPLRIAQRMRLEATQLDGVARRMMVESDYCLLLALPCGRDQEDVVNQTDSLKAAFITYLQAKQAAGIINVPNPGSNQPAYVLQIFPPCEFSESHLSRLAPDLLTSISNISPHLMIVIASV